MEYRELDRQDISDLAQIDRSESIDRIYYVRDGDLILVEEHWDVGDWSASEKQECMVTLEAIFDRGATFFGAFDDGLLVGMSAVDHNPLPSGVYRLDLAGLWVSDDYRKQGVGTKLVRLVEREAREGGQEPCTCQRRPRRTPCVSTRRWDSASRSWSIPIYMRRNPRTFTWRRCCDRQLLAVVVPGSEPGWLNVKDRTMDGLARYNRARWEELACTNVEYSQPYLDLDSSSARGIVDQHGLLGDVAGRKVLCLASGGGQQSAAFGLLEAQVTVLDLSETQLQRDRQAAEHYGLDVRTIQGDMRDLSALSSDEFDIVWQPYSINFVPSVVPVFQEVARVVRPGGRYMVEFANPFTHFAVDEDAWDGKGYPLKYPYTDGEEVTGLNPDWRYWDVQTEGGKWVKVESPREFRHTLGTLINGLAREGFVILGAWEDASGDQNAKPGTWEHLKSIAPPWLSLWTTYRPDGDGRDTTRLRSGTPEKWMGQAEACTGDRLATDGSDAGAG